MTETPKFADFTFRSRESIQNDDSLGVVSRLLYACERSASCMGRIMLLAPVLNDSLHCDSDSDLYHPNVISQWRCYTRIFAEFYRQLSPLKVP